MGCKCCDDFGFIQGPAATIIDCPVCKGKKQKLSKDQKKLMEEMPLPPVRENK